MNRSNPGPQWVPLQSVTILPQASYTVYSISHCEVPSAMQDWVFASFARDLHKLMLLGKNGYIRYQGALRYCCHTKSVKLVSALGQGFGCKRGDQLNLKQLKCLGNKTWIEILLAKKNARDFSSAKSLQLRPRCGFNISGPWHAWLPDISRAQRFGLWHRSRWEMLVLRRMFGDGQSYFSMVKIQNHPSNSQWNLELDVSGDCFLKEDVSGLGNLMYQHFPNSGICWRNFQWTQMFLLAQTLISRWLHPGTFNLDTQNDQFPRKWRSIFPKAHHIMGALKPPLGFSLIVPASFSVPFLMWLVILSRAQPDSEHAISSGFCVKKTGFSRQRIRCEEWFFLGATDLSLRLLAMYKLR